MNKEAIKNWRMSIDSTSDELIKKIVTYIGLRLPEFADEFDMLDGNTVYDKDGVVMLQDITDHKVLKELSLEKVLEVYDMFEQTLRSLIEDENY